MSKTLGKSINYISKARFSKYIDLELVIKKCPDADFNWLLTGDEHKERKIAKLDDKGNRIEVALNGSQSDLNEVDEIIKQLKEKDFILFETMKQLHEKRD